MVEYGYAHIASKVLTQKLKNEKAPEFGAVFIKIS